MQATSTYLRKMENPTSKRDLLFVLLTIATRVIIIRIYNEALGPYIARARAHIHLFVRGGGRTITTWLAEAAGKYGRLAVWSGVTLDEHTWSRGLLSDESYTLDHGAIADVHTD